MNNFVIPATMSVKVSNFLKKVNVQLNRRDVKLSEDLPCGCGSLSADRITPTTEQRECKCDWHATHKLTRQVVREY